MVDPVGQNLPAEAPQQRRACRNLFPLEEGGGGICDLDGERVRRLPVDWIVATGACFGVTLLISRSQALSHSSVRSVIWCLGGVGMGICIWKAFEQYRNIERAHEVRLREQQRVEELDRRLIDDPALWTGLQQSLQQLIDATLLPRWEVGDGATKEQEAMSAKIAELVMLQIKQACEVAVVHEWDQPAIGDMVGDPQAIRDLVEEFTQGDVGNAMRTAAQTVAQKLAERATYERLFEKRPALMHQGAEWTEDFLTAVHRYDRNLEGTEGPEILRAVRFRSDMVADTPEEEIRRWTDFYREWLGNEFADVEGVEGRRCRIAARALCHALAIGTVRMADALLDRANIEQAFHRAVEALKAGEPADGPPQDFITPEETEDLKRVTRVFLDKAGGANAIGRWFVRRADNQLVEATNGGLTSIFQMRNGRVEFKPDLVNEALDRQITDLKNPPDAAEMERRHREVRAMHHAIEDCSHEIAGSRVKGWFAENTVGVFHAIKWSHRAAHQYPRVLRHFAFRAIEHGLDELQQP